MNFRTTAWLAFATMAPLHGATVIEGVTVTATSQWTTDSVGASVNLTNNSGLSAPYEVGASHDFAGDAARQWHTQEADTTPTLTFDLGGAFDLEAVYIWNANQTNLTDRGVQQFDVLVSTDGVNFSEVLSNLALAQSSGNGSTTVLAQSFSFSSASGITHVRLHVDSNHGGNVVGLSEVMFTSVPEPSVVVLGALSLLPLFRRRRR